MNEMGYLFDTLVGDSNEGFSDVSILKNQVSDLTIPLSTVTEERDKMKCEAENRERKVKDVAEKIVLQAQKLFVEKSQKWDMIVQELLENINVMEREKCEALMLNSTHEMKISHLECEVGKLNNLLENSGNEERLMRAKILELEESLDLATEKVGDMENKNEELLRENKGMELNLKVLHSELVDANRVRKEIEKVKVSRENEVVELQGEINGLRVALDEVNLEKENIEKGFDVEITEIGSLELQTEEMEKKTAQLLYRYKNDVDELKLENDTIKKEFDEEKTKVEHLKVQVAGMEEKIEEAEAKLGQMRSKTVKLNKKNKKLESHVDLLVAELLSEKRLNVRALDNANEELEGIRCELVDANRAREEIEKIKTSRENEVVKLQGEINGLRASVGICWKSDLKSLRGIMSNYNLKLVTARMVDEVELNEKDKKLESHVDILVKVLGALQGSLLEAQQKCNDLELLKQQLVSMKNNVAEANRVKNLSAAMSVVTTVLVAVLMALISKYY